MLERAGDDKHDHERGYDQGRDEDQVGDRNRESVGPPAGQRPVRIVARPTEMTRSFWSRESVSSTAFGVKLASLR